METIITLLFMAILYIASIMWGKFLDKVKRNSNVHNPVVPAAGHAASQERKKSKYVASNLEIKSPVTAQNVSNLGTEKSEWRGQLDHNSIINGVIFSEILEPPRAYRPFKKR